MFEPLEGRLLLSVSMNVFGSVTVTGTHADDEIVLLSRGEQIVVRENGKASRFTASQVTRIEVLGRQGDDIIDARRLVNTPPFKMVKLFGGPGDDRLESSRVPDGASYLYGGPGGDRLRAWGSEFVYLHGQAGDDLIVGLMARGFTGYGGYGSDRIFGGAGADWLFGGAPDIADDGAADFVDAAGGDDRVVHDSAADVYAGAEQVRPSVIPLVENVGVPAFRVGPSGTGSEWGVSISVVFPHGGNYITFGEIERDGNEIRLPVRTYGAGSRRHLPPPVTATASLGELPAGVYRVLAVRDDGEVIAKRTVTVT
jgi:hypothetical protein